MDQHQSERFRKPSSSRKFLLSKTNFKPEVAKTKIPISMDAKNELFSAFPDIQTGEPFIDEALAGLSASQAFGAMVIQIDDFNVLADGFSELQISTARVKVAKAIDRVCQVENGLWGILDAEMLGCFFAEKNGTSCLNLAQKIQQHLSKHGKETVSIGIAAYPMIHFERDQIMVNARKALKHAGFFGPASIVSFDAVSLNISGDQLYDQGDIEGAAQEFKTALKLDPSNVNVHNSLGVCYSVMGDLEKGLHEFKTAITLDPAEVMAVYNAGLTSTLMDKKAQALEYLLDANRINDKVFEVVFQTGRLYIEMKEPVKARPYLEKATTFRPDFAVAFTCLGESYQEMGMTSEAVAAYKKALQQNSNDAAALSALGWLLDVQGENIEITTLFCKQSVDIAPENGLFRYRLGQLYLKQDRLEDALFQFKAADRFGHDSRLYIEQIENQLTAGAS
jgi:tetratricopeptide (TPR) repeat protein